MMQTHKLISIVLLLFVTGCIMAGNSGQKKKKDDQILFSEAQKAFNAKDYVDAIKFFQIFAERFPKSERYTWALQRLGESFEGLLEMEYLKRVENGEQEKEAKKEFLSKHGHYSCWEETPDGLKYNLMHYKIILDKFPDSAIADESAYRTIAWEKDYMGRPVGPLRELTRLKQILEQYPSTSLRHEILYEMALRCHILSEIYAFSPSADTRDAEKAEQYRNKALYLYKLSLNSPRHTKYSQKSWKGLKMLEEGKGRIYILE